ncbi:MAG: hypothetical protein QXY62_04150 [Candidatus Altiarchaeota archaeon]
MEIKKILNGILIAFVSLLLILNLQTIIFLNAIRSTVLNPEFYIKELDESNFFKTSEEKEVLYLIIKNFLSYINSQTSELSLKIYYNGKEQDILGNLDLERRAEIEKAAFELRKSVGFVNTLFYASIFGAILFALILVYISRKIEKILLKIGIAFFITGSSALILKPMVFSMLSEKSQITENLKNLPISSDIFMKILSDIFQPVNDFGILLIAFSIILFVLSFIIKKKFS